MKTAFIRLLTAGLPLLAGGVLHAQSMVPSAMNYQGFLTDNSGNPVANSGPENRNLEFRIYSVATEGTAHWGEAQAVTVYKGNFSVILGNGTAIGGLASGAGSLANLFANPPAADLFFGIKPEGAAEFTPRQRLLSSAYALRARMAEQVNQTSGDSRFNWVYANNLTMQGHTKINGGNVLEFGTNDASRNRNTAAGQIGYQTYSNGLDIVGAGPDSANRRVTFWAEAGTHFKGPISFEPGYRQNFSMWDSNNGIGLQPDVFYMRSYEGFEWYKRGVHNDAAGNPGAGGTRIASLTTGGFNLRSGVFTGDGSGLTNINPNSLPNNYNYLGINGGNIIEFGRGVAGKDGSAGKIGYATFTAGALDIVGAGTAGNNRRIKLWAEGGLTTSGGATVEANLRVNSYTELFGALYAKGDVVIEGDKKLKFETPNRLGQHINLWGSEYGIGIQNGTMYQRVGNSDAAFRWYAGGSHTDNGGPGTGGVEIANWTAGRCDFNRRVYIAGDSNSTFAPLEVNGAANSYQIQRYISEFWNPNNGGSGYNGREWFWTRLSIRASHQIAATSFIAYSDERLKNPQGRSDSANDLKTLSALEVTDYTMKDKMDGGAGPQKKLIAQQVEQIYPQAVSKTTGIIPDILRPATAKEGRITFKKAEGLQVKRGDTVRIIHSGGDLKTEVKALIEGGFTVADAIKDGEVVVYGRQVDDLRLVDYEAIAMLNVSATQELARQVQAQAAELAAVKAERDALAKEVAAVHAAAVRQDKRLAAIEAQIEALAHPAAQTVSHQAKVRGE